MVPAGVDLPGRVPLGGPEVEECGGRHHRPRGVAHLAPEVTGVVGLGAEQGTANKSAISIKTSSDKIRKMYLPDVNFEASTLIGLQGDTSGGEPWLG